MTNRTQKIFAVSAIIVSAILWGFDGVYLTPNLFQLDVGFVVFMLHLIPFVIMNTFLFREYRHLKDISLHDLSTFFLVALFGGALGTLAIVRALFLVQFNHLSIVVLLQKLQPIFAISLAAIILKEKLTKHFVGWSALAIVASYFLTFGWNLPQINAQNHLLEAALWALLAAFSFGASTVFSKKALQKYSFYTTNFYRFGITTILMLIFVLLSGKFSEFSTVTTRHWTFFIIIALTTGSGTIFLYYYGLNKVSAMVSTICELFFPISAVFFDYLINKQSLTLAQWLSAFIMILAILKISYRRKRVR
jgi:drug/metabolite transporter (DMT)-like permease